MSTGYINTYLIVMITLLITAINFICFHDNNFSRRDALIETLKNADKLARYDERLTFLCECRRSEIYPKFIHSLVNPIQRVFRTSHTLKKRISSGLCVMCMYLPT